MTESEARALVDAVFVMTVMDFDDIPAGTKIILDGARDMAKVEGHILGSERVVRFRYAASVVPIPRVAWTPEMRLMAVRHRIEKAITVE